MTLSFRNLDIDPSAPVESWPYEGVVAAIERGTVTDWARLTSAMRRDPWGDVARQVEEFLSYERPQGVGALLERAVVSAREQAESRERREVAETVDALVRSSGLGAAAFARRIGTSRSRLSTYRTGRVVPSATLLLRMQRVEATIRSSRPAGRKSVCRVPPRHDTTLDHPVRLHPDDRAGRPS